MHKIDRCVSRKIVSERKRISLIKRKGEYGESNSKNKRKWVVKAEVGVRVVVRKLKRNVRQRDYSETSISWIQEHLGPQISIRLRLRYSKNISISNNIYITLRSWKTPSAYTARRYLKRMRVHHVHIHISWTFEHRSNCFNCFSFEVNTI